MSCCSPETSWSFPERDARRFPCDPIPLPIKTDKAFAMPRIPVALAFAAAVVAAAPAAALEWDLEPSIATRYDYNTNTRLLQSGHDSGWDVALTPGFRATAQSASTAFTWTGGLSAVHNSVIDPRNRVDANSGLAWRYSDERSTWALNMNYVRDLTLASELTTTGYLNQVVTRNAYTAAPSYTRALTERLSATLGLTGNWSRYGHTGDNGLNDYDSYSAAPGLIYALSPRTSATFTLAGSYFRASPLDSTSQSDSASVGLSHQYSERLQVSASVGYAHTRSHVASQLQCLLPTSAGLVQEPNEECEFASPPVTLTTVPGADSSRNSPVYNLAVTWAATELTTLTASAAEAIVPSGLGATLDSRSYGLALAQKLTERLSASLSGQLAASRFAGGTSLGSNSQYRGLNANLNWKVTQQWSMDTGYRYAEVLFPGGSSSLHNNTVYAALRYDFTRMALSR